IIRAQFLQKITDAYAENAGIANLLLAPYFKKIADEYQQALRDEFRMKPAPGAEPVKWYKNTYGGRFAVYRIADCVPMREKRPL
ncbi:hypothetical protein MJN69_30745, partial [Salmonella enterica subsp. enterica serovar Kentucky]|nr:hypothetical protein [Salmonella enterica subsp. enterica serovar Kentucky]